MDSYIDTSKLLQNPVNYSKKISVGNLTTFIKTAIESYENSEAIIPDHIYDTIFDVLKQRDPDNSIFKTIG